MSSPATDWPWCIDCGSWHAPGNPTCRKLTRSPAVTRRGRKILLALTPAQVEALRSLLGAANDDGDHEDWLRSAQVPPSEIRSCREVMRLSWDALLLARALQRKPLR